MPISEKQLAANRANAQKSTGPKSAPGKLHTSRNGLRYGLLARTILLDGESRVRFQEIFDALCDEFQPTTAGEYSLIDKAAVYQWRLLRAWMFETVSIREAMRSQTGAVAQQDLPTRAMLAARSLNDNSRQPELNSRYETRFDLQHHRALRDLQRLKAEKLAGAPKTHQPEENKRPEQPGKSRENPSVTHLEDEKPPVEPPANPPAPTPAAPDPGNHRHRSVLQGDTPPDPARLMEPKADPPAPTNSLRRLHCLDASYKILKPTWNRFHVALNAALARTSQGELSPMKSHRATPMSARTRSPWLSFAGVTAGIASLACITLLAQSGAAPATPKAAAPRAAAKAAPATAARSTAPRRIEILFLGADTPEHSSQKATALFVPAMAREGINVSWTDDLADLNARNLAKYDVLMVYGDFQTLSPAQEIALTGYVAGGKGLVAIHSASDMFRNSAAWGKLIGGQLDHKGPVSTFTAAVKAPQHPVLREFTPFETKDETYVHKNAAADRTVLMDRAEGSGREAVSWVRNDGKGRVFYTALGHDENTWKNASFTALLRGAVLWTAGDAVRAQWEKLQMPSVSYKPSVFIPNYERRVPPLKFQEPLSPQDSMKTMQVPPGFEVQLFASEPDITKPIAMNWDERGRLWVVESVDYPNDFIPNMPDKTGHVGHDRIKICEDTNGDGKADKFTIFAEGLNIPTGITFWNGGVIVGQAPDMLYLKSSKGDDKADIRQVLQHGWGLRDTHSGIGNLQYGFDNFIWGSIGYSGFMGTTPDGKGMNFAQGIFRMHPDGTGMEFMGAFSNNTWGLGMTETFDTFGSTANNTHAVYVGIPPRYSADVKGLPVRAGSKKIDGHYFMAPDTFNVRQVDVMGGFTAANGFNFYTARVYPKEYWDRIAFVNEPTGRVVHRAILEKNGAGYKEKDGWNLVSSSDEWFEPVLTQVGPDGEVWIADLYNFIVQHNPTPIGFDNGFGGAYENPLRDHTRGRIYRIVYKGAPKAKVLSLSKQRPAELVAALSNDNMFWRLTAQRLLVERANKDVVPQLLTLAATTKVDELGLNPGALHALWTLEGLGVANGSNPAVTTALVASLKNPAAGVRKAGIQILPANDASLKAVRDAGLLADKDPYTRLSAILFLTRFPASDSIGAELYKMSKAPDIQKDEFLNMAVYDAAAKNRAGFFKAMEADMGSAAFKAYGEKIAVDEATPKPPINILSQTQQGAGTVIPPDPIIPVPEGLMHAYAEDVVGHAIVRPPPNNGGRGGGAGRGRGGTPPGPFAQDIKMNINVQAMTYSVSSITAKPGDAIRITLTNNGDVQHNVVLIRPGSIDVVGAQVEAMAKVPNAEERSYLPPTPDILFWMKLVETGQTGTLAFYAPNMPGDYPFLCTFPGHWQTMRGVLHVAN